MCFAKDHLRLERIQGLTCLELLVKANQGLTGPLLDSPVSKAAIWGCFIPPISGEIGDWFKILGLQLYHIIEEAWRSALC